MNGAQTTVPAPAWLGDRWLARRPARPPRATSLASILPFGLAFASGLAWVVSPFLGGGSVVALVVLLVVRRTPGVLLPVVVAGIYSNAMVILVQQASLPSGAGILVPLALCIPLAQRRVIAGRPFVLPPILPLMLLFAAVQAVSALASQDPGAALVDLITFLTEGLLLVFLVTNTVVTVPLLRQVAWTLIIVGGLLGLLSIIQQVTGTYNIDYLGFAKVSRAVITTNSGGQVLSAPRLAGPVGEKNRYAQTLAVLIPLGIVLIGLQKQLWRRLLLVVLVGLCCGGIVLTYSRGAAVGLVAVGLLAVVLRMVRLRWLVSLVVVAVIGLSFVPAYAGRLASLDSLGGATAATGDTGAADNAVRGRATENIAAILAFLDHPLVGVGPGLFPTVYPYYAQLVGIRARSEQREAHNLVLGIAAEDGLFGIGLFLAILWIVLLNLWRARVAWASRDPERAALAGGFLLVLATYIATGMFLHLSYQRYFWILVALGMCAAVLPDAPAVDEPDPVAAVPPLTSSISITGFIPIIEEDELHGMNGQALPVTGSLLLTSSRAAGSKGPIPRPSSPPSSPTGQGQ